MAEEITLHGGPQHGTTMAIEEGKNHLVAHHLISEKGGKYTRASTYTRVTHSGIPSSSFEWSGYSGEKHVLLDEPKPKPKPPEKQ